jgi:hypothetical protein
MAKFEERDEKLFINGKEVLIGWESVDGGSGLQPRRYRSRRA